jgi:predicted dehydrogenase
VIKSPEINLVDNCLPNALHYEPTILAMEAGKNVICEKPLACNVKEAREMVKVARKQGVKNLVGFMLRYAPAIIRAKSLIERGFIGKVFHFRGLYGHSRIVDPSIPIEWRLKKSLAGGGAIFDLGSHVIDLARYLVGEIRAVTGHTETFIKERPTVEGGKDVVDVDDAAIALLKFENGAIGTLEASRFDTGFIDELRIEVHGGNGAIRFSLMDFNTLEVFSRKDDKEVQGFKRITVDAPPPSVWPPPKSTKGVTRAHVGMIHHYINCIINDQMPSPSFEDGLIVQEIIEAILESSSKEKWITI